MNHLGIDPGMSGGVGIIEDDGTVVTFAFSKLTEKDIADLISGFEKEGTFAYIENVHSMPKQGVASSFKFGKSFGFLLGCLACAEIPFELVSPQKWQKFMGCLTHGDKNISKAKAQQLFPTLRITHANSDALLIAEYGRRTRCKSGN